MAEVIRERPPCCKMATLDMFRAFFAGVLIALCESGAFGLVIMRFRFGGADESDIGGKKRG